VAHRDSVVDLPDERLGVVDDELSVPQLEGASRVALVVEEVGEEGPPLEPGLKVPVGPVPKLNGANLSQLDNLDRFGDPSCHNQPSFTGCLPVDPDLTGYSLNVGIAGDHFRRVSRRPIRPFHPVARNLEPESRTESACVTERCFSEGASAS